jgi:hypothetical protein
VFDNVMRAGWREEEDVATTAVAMSSCRGQAVDNVTRGGLDNAMHRCCSGGSWH